MTAPLYNGMIGGSPIGLMTVSSAKLTTNIVVNIPVSVSLTGVGATGGVGTFSISASSSATLTGVAAAGGVGHVTPQVSHTMAGAAASEGAGTFSTELGISMTLPSAHSALAIGAFDPTPTITLKGISAPTHAGAVTSIIFGEGYMMSNLQVTVQPPEDDTRDVSLRYSDTKGASFGNRIMQPLGNEGQYLTSMQWRRLGMGRDRIFELSWTVPCETSVVGAFIEYETAET